VRDLAHASGRLRRGLFEAKQVKSPVPQIKNAGCTPAFFIFTERFFIFTEHFFIFTEHFLNCASLIPTERV
jgi:hypothetical protein